MLDALIIASHNKGKVKEIAELLEPLGISVSNADEHNLPEPEETGTTFAANAALKADAACEATGKACLADDSGLAVPALDGAPGIYSARWGGPQKDFNLAMQRVKKELEAKHIEPQGADAYFVCNLALALPGKATQHFEGKVEGTLTFPPRGEKGFGYDPIFIPHGHDVSFAEIDPAQKQRISHRANAFAALYSYLSQSTDVA